VERPVGEDQARQAACHARTICAVEPSPTPEETCL
jgi:hypothetical protein